MREVGPGLELVFLGVVLADGLDPKAGDGIGRIGGVGLSRPEQSLLGYMPKLDVAAALGSDLGAESTSIS